MSHVAQATSSERTPARRPARLLSLYVRVVVLLGAGVVAGSLFNIPSMPQPFAWLLAIYFLLNPGFIATAVGLDAGASPLRIWHRHFRWLWLSYLASASTAFCLVLLMQQLKLGALAVVLPLIAVFYMTLRSSLGR